MRIAAAALAFVLVACATNKDVERPPSLVPPPDPAAVGATSNDPRVDELQTSLTELLERIDVLNARIAKLESGGAGFSPTAPVAPSSAPAPAPAGGLKPAAPQAESPLRSANIADDYRNALMLFGKSHWADARAAFQRVFDADPSGDLADNALFWVGETYFAAGDYTSAMRYYERVTKEYGEANKAPDAMLKMGLAFEKKGDLAMAHKAFDDCIRRYPYSTAAATAKLELKRIKY